MILQISYCTDRDPGVGSEKLSDQILQIEMSEKPNSTDIASVTSEEIFHGKQSLTIIHGGSAYTLRITKQNKLILTK